MNIPSNWDFYAGLSLGFYFWNSSGDYPGDHTSGMGLGLQVGGRYYFNEKFGLNLQLGGGTIGAGRFGVSIRFLNLELIPYNMCQSVE
jgi:outer membrane immunogenic protein